MRAVVGRISLNRHIVLAIVIGCALLGMLLWLDHVQTRYYTLMANPQPLPNWLSDLAPAPGEILSKANLGQHSIVIPYNSRGAELCIQLNASYLPTNSIPEIEPRMSLYLNGLPVAPLGMGYMFQGLSLVHGTRVASYALDSNLRRHQDLINVCWTMPLSIGSYWASLYVNWDVSPTLNYEWAFQVTH